VPLLKGVKAGGLVAAVETGSQQEGEQEGACEGTIHCGFHGWSIEGISVDQSLTGMPQAAMRVLTSWMVQVP
jgi:hypothetical protein